MTFELLPPKAFPGVIKRRPVISRLHDLSRTNLTGGNGSGAAAVALGAHPAVTVAVEEVDQRADDGPHDEAHPGGGPEPHHHQEAHHRSGDAREPRPRRLE